MRATVPLCVVDALGRTLLMQPRCPAALDCDDVAAALARSGCACAAAAPALHARMRLHAVHAASAAAPTKAELAAAAATEPLHVRTRVAGVVGPRRVVTLLLTFGAPPPGAIRPFNGAGTAGCGCAAALCALFVVPLCVAAARCAVACC
jgi:hypothetical protein